MVLYRNMHKVSLEKDRERIAGMFDRIAPHYDRLNRLLSFRTDIRWRKRLVAEVQAGKPGYVLDLACGTGDVSLALWQAGIRTAGADISGQMLAIAREKTGRICSALRKSPNPAPPPDFYLASAEELPFPDNTFDAVTISFGIRNFDRRPECFQEIRRVLKPGGKLLVLELSKPRNRIWRNLYGFYSGNILPLVGRCISGDRTAYRYLPASVSDFPSGDAFLEEYRRCGFLETACRPLTGGIATLYRGRKPGEN